MKVLPLALVLLSPILVSGQQAELSLEVDRVRAAPGETLEVAVVVSTEQALTSASAFVSFDDSLLELVPEQVMRDGTLVPFRPGAFLAGVVYENSTAGDGTAASNGLAGFQLNYVVVQGMRDGRSGAAGRGVLASFRLRARNRPGGGEGRVWLDGTGQRRPVYTLQGRPGVEGRFERPSDPLVVTVLPGTPALGDQGATRSGSGPPTPQPGERAGAGEPAGAGSAEGDGGVAAAQGQPESDPLELAQPAPIETVVGGENAGPLLEELVVTRGVDLSGLEVQLEGDDFAYAWVRDRRLVVRGLQEGRGTVRVEVRDGSGRRATTELTVVVRNPGDSPVIGEVPELSVRVGETQVLALSGLVTDQDTPLGRLSWNVQATGGVRAQVDGSSEPVLRISAVAAGEGRIDLEVTDPEGNSSAVSFRVQLMAPEEALPEISGPPEGSDPDAAELPPVEPVSVDTLPTAILAAPHNQAARAWHAAYPNPFNARVVLGYSVAEKATVRLAIYDGQGRHVCTLVDREQAAGSWEAVWDGRTADGDEAASGVYLYQGDAGAQHWCGKVLLLR